MIVDTRKALFAAAVIVATGVVAVELSRSSAHAESVLAPDQRVEAAFDVAAMAPPAEPAAYPMATKGDLEVPLGCFTTPRAERDECMDVAYEEQSTIVETRIGNTSTLMRIESMTVAEFADLENQNTAE